MLESANLPGTLVLSLPGGEAFNGGFPLIVGSSTANKSRKRVLQVEAQQNAQAVSNCEQLTENEPSSLAHRSDCSKQASCCAHMASMFFKSGTGQLTAWFDAPKPCGADSRK